MPLPVSAIDDQTSPKSPVKERAQPSREEITVDTKLSPETRANGVGQAAWRRRAQGEAKPLWIWC